MSKMPSPPRDLTNEDALREWKRITPLLEKDDKVRVIDQQTVAIYCRFVAITNRALLRVESEGETIDGYRGSKVKHPALQAARDCANTVARYAKMLAITPEGRANLKVDEGPPSSPGDADDFND